MIQVLEKLKDAADKAALDASKKHGLSASYNVVDIEPLPDDIWKDATHHRRNGSRYTALSST